MRNGQKATWMQCFEMHHSAASGTCVCLKRTATSVGLLPALVLIVLSAPSWRSCSTASSLSYCTAIHRACRRTSVWLYHRPSNPSGEELATLAAPLTVRFSYSAMPLGSAQWKQLKTTKKHHILLPYSNISHHPIEKKQKKNSFDPFRSAAMIQQHSDLYLPIWISNESMKGASYT